MQFFLTHGEGYTARDVCTSLKIFEDYIMMSVCRVPCTSLGLCAKYLPDDQSVGIGKQNVITEEIQDFLLNSIRRISPTSISGQSNCLKQVYLKQDLYRTSIIVLLELRPNATFKNDG